MLAFFSQGGEFTLKHLVQNPFFEFGQVSSQPLEEWQTEVLVWGSLC